MGNQPSKGGRRFSNDGPPLESLPSFSRSDTKESSRSLRSSIRSKVPSSVARLTESPRPAAAVLAKQQAANVDKSDAASVRSAISQSASTRKSLDESGHRGSDASLQPPPSPSISPSIGQGHGDITKAQRSGEIEHVSEAPPVGALHSTTNVEPGESILTRKEPQSLVTKLDSIALTDASTSPGTMDLPALKKTDLDELIKRLIDAGYAGKVTKTVCLKNAEIIAVCTAARDVFLSQPPLLELAPSVKIVGDVHGQYADLIRLFEMCGFPPSSNYLFLGDYVDRGKQSLETILLLLCYKLRYPENFFLLRGNHECANVTRVYGFYDECKRRCNIKIWKAFVDTFNTLPIASIVAGKIFCVHGGLSPSLSHMDDIRQIVRPTDVPDYGLLNDLLWSDPAEMDSDWEANERGVSYCFGKKVIMEFLQKHDFDLVCRAHMVVEDGYEFFQDRVLVTVFSAPNVRTTY